MDPLAYIEPGIMRRSWRVLTITVGILWWLLTCVASEAQGGEIVLIAIIVTLVTFGVSAGISYIFTKRLW